MNFSKEEFSFSRYLNDKNLKISINFDIIIIESLRERKKQHRRDEEPRLDIKKYREVKI